MTEERWEKLVEMAKNDFENVSYYTEDMLFEVAEGHLKDGTQDILEFTNDRGAFKVIRQNRIDFQPRVKFYKESFGDWEELDVENLDIFK
jgi:hypothetical protein